MALYGNILEALEGYYGADVMQKVYNRGVQLGLSGNKQWGDYYKLLANNTDDLIEWTTKSGKSVGLWSVRGTTSTTEVALSSTATDLVSVDMALGTEVGEYAGKQIPKLVTAGGTSGSTTVGSFVVGEVLPAIGAAACGVVLGVAVDKLLYKSNPDYWDEKLPTLNPETWDDIILCHDTKIPFLHNTENGKTYIKEDMLTYMADFGNKNGYFATGGEYDEKTDTDTNFNGYVANVTKFLPNAKVSKKGETVLKNASVLLVGDAYFTKIANNTGIYILSKDTGDTQVIINFENGESLTGIHHNFDNSWGTFDYDNKIAHASQGSQANAIKVVYKFEINQVIYYLSDISHL